MAFSVSQFNVYSSVTINRGAAASYSRHCRLYQGEG